MYDFSRIAKRTLMLILATIVLGAAGASAQKRETPKRIVITEKELRPIYKEKANEVLKQLDLKIMGLQELYYTKVSEDEPTSITPAMINQMETKTDDETPPEPVYTEAAFVRNIRVFLPMKTLLGWMDSMAQIDLNLTSPARATVAEERLYAEKWLDLIEFVMNESQNQSDTYLEEFAKGIRSRIVNLTFPRPPNVHALNGVVAERKAAREAAEKAAAKPIEEAAQTPDATSPAQSPASETPKAPDTPLEKYRSYYRSTQEQPSE